MEEEGDTEAAAATQPQKLETLPRPTVACLRCRDQKLKCDRELPSCVRCRRQRAVCEYPSPPDRRSIARRTIQARASALGAALNSKEQSRRVENGGGGNTLGKRQRINDPPQDNPRDGTISLGPVLSKDLGSTEDAELPPTEVGLLLLEVYFKRVYNASLLFNKSIAFQLYQQHHIPDYLLRAIYAQAAVFLQQVDSAYEKYIDIFPVQTIYDKSWSWARSASREVLSNVDEPTLVRVQALQVLHLYYFSRGAMQRAEVHASLAYQLSQVLGYDRLHEDVALLSSRRSRQLDHEMKRRCFWASWASLSMGGCSGHSNYCKMLDRFKGLPLPARFEKTGSVQGVELKLSQKIADDENSDTSQGVGQGQTPITMQFSLMAELIKLLGVWSEVQTFITESPSHSQYRRLADLDKLMELFSPIERSLDLPLDEICTRADVYNESPELLTSLVCMYHLSKLLMHASMVPSFSGRPLESGDSVESVQKHTEAALQQAIKFAELLQRFIARDLDMTRLWHCTGYGAFIAGSVFVVYHNRMQTIHGALDKSLKVPGLESKAVKTIQTVMEVLSIYWEPIRWLTIKLNKTIRSGKFTDLDPITLPTDAWERYRGGSTPEAYDDKISILNNSSINVPLFQTPLAEEEQSQDMARHEMSMKTGQIPSEQHVALHARFAPDMHSAQCLDPAAQFLEQHIPGTMEGGLFDLNWGNTMSMMGMLGHGVPSLIEMPSRDPVLFYDVFDSSS